ncbi:ATP-dependent nuclease [Candidatus Enterococcus ikei]|uniref:AAA family ATPase n=1 Tax=Candidatus Enterococcus ikei TaxID=2815326 RepID=A0ABS3GUR6_9ENTE|nr:AAA family ATPase [Enterococcus sp. DIV0869a]MBO0438895.1 AAA family ATPase [Enterococcus sp. DIV0869a]
MKQIKELVSTIQKKKNRGDFKKYIDKIYFPYYKNFAEFSEITFPFPLTVFVGKNGTGKSSLLHALYGAPDGYNINTYWFSSSMDPIEETGENGKRHCFVYEYRNENQEEVQVLIQRAPRPGTKTKKANLDYWETAKPVSKYRMDTKKGRGALLKTDVTYLDFRGILSAYDKFFYFGSTKGLRSSKKQDFIRNKSPQLSSAINQDKIKYSGKIKQNEKPISLNKEELKWISFILGYRYSEGKIIYHKLYQEWGYSVILKKEDLKYSEAHAGSGEFSAVTLVHELLKLKDNQGGLILIDEAEVSLHPGAQYNLLQFLLEIIKRKNVQIIMCTHSPQIVEYLPSEAINIVTYNTLIKKVEIQKCFEKKLAFKDLGVNIDRYTIYVEDNCAKIVLEAFLSEKKLSEAYCVQFLGGGVEDLKKGRILSNSQCDNKQEFFILDGDTYVEMISPEDYTSKQSKDINFVKGQLDKIKCGKLPFSFDSNSSNVKKIESYIKYINYYLNYVNFFPEEIPEDIIWDSEYLLEKINKLNFEIDLEENDKKNIYAQIASKEFMKLTDGTYESFILDLTRNWIQKKDKNYDFLENVLTKIIKQTKT